MTEIRQHVGRDSQTPPLAKTNSGVLIGIGGLMTVLTNAVIFILPPLLPVIQAHYELASVAETTWLYTALTLGGGAGFILLPRLADVFSDRGASVAALALLTLGALVPAIGDSYLALVAGCVLMGFGCAAQFLRWASCDAISVNPASRWASRCSSSPPGSASSSG